jgi:hypothetical protein
LLCDSGSLNIPGGIALDGHGDLWVANAGNDTIAEYTSDLLTQDGSPVPALTLGSGGGLFRPTGLVFDASGCLGQLDREILSSEETETKGARARDLSRRLAASRASHDVRRGGGCEAQPAAWAAPWVITHPL